MSTFLFCYIDVYESSNYLAARKKNLLFVETNGNLASSGVLYGRINTINHNFLSLAICLGTNLYNVQLSIITQLSVKL